MATRVTQTNIFITTDKGKILQRMSFEQRAELRKEYKANIPGWRHTGIGYIATPFIIGLALIATFVMAKVLEHLYFPGSLLTLAILLIASLWGVGPALLSVLVSTLALDYYFVPPLNELSMASWQGVLQLIPFIIVGLTISIITSQRERARLNALIAERQLQIQFEELETINQKLESANATKDHFLSIASHELKTPITTIRGLAQLVLRRMAKQKELSPDMEVIRTTLEKINDQTGRLTTLIQELMDVSSIRAGKLELRKKTCDLGEICRDVVEDQHLLTGRTIQLELPKDALKMEVDCDRLAQVLVNLIGNALKYSPENTPIEVSAQQNDHHALVQIRDYGKGIAKEQQERIFETFYRTPEATASPKQGLGLGLAISKDIVERHQGRIWCESELNRGSSFFVELPLK